MIAFIVLTFLAALESVFLLFLARMRQGLRWLPSPGDGAVTASAPPPRVAVVVAMRNEASTIKDCIASLAAQDHPHDRMRFILVDDASQDDTGAIARAATAGDERFHVLTNTGTPGKKGAITTGVMHCDADIVLTTDADCRHRPAWVRTMVGTFTPDTDIVSGPVVYGDRRTLFARIQALEFLGLVGIGAGFIGIGHPRLCNGANLAYRRRTFIDAGGYAGNDRIASGDDEFLLHRIVEELGGRADFASTPDAVVETDPARSFTAFLRQRQRWASKTVHYTDGRFIAFLVLLFSYFLLLSLGPWVLASSPVGLAVFAFLFAVGSVAETTVVIATARLLHQPVRLPDLLVAALLHPPYIVISTLLGILGKGSWKNRPLTP